MSFNSIIFVVFALMVVLVWRLLPHLNMLRWITLTAASLIFYGFHKESRLLSFLYILMAGVIVYLVGLILGKARSARKFWFITGLLVTIGTLAVFKYAGLVAQLLQSHFGFFAGQTGFPVRYPMPLAVSFISFQLASYLIDIYRGQLAPCRNIVKFFAFVTFFPKLIAGPVVRGSVLLTQFEEPRIATASQRWTGSRQFIVGLFKKSVVADNLGPLVNVAFVVAPVQSSGYWWIMALIYTAQSYADFSGYSDMAIGTARLLGFEIPPNFAHPFNAAGFREFWGRWHISVSTWFRDYLFLPLAKHWLPRVRPSLRHLAMHLIIWTVMVISGVWHGVSPGYAIWGALNAAYLSVEMLYNWPARLSRTLLGRIAAVLLTVLLWSFSQIIFRATNLKAALEIVRIMFSFNSFDLTDVAVDPRRLLGAWYPAILGALVVEHAWVAYRARRRTEKRETGQFEIWIERLEPVGLSLLLLAAVLLRGPDAEFVYFKF
jgi:D-alanyl-lipoteichoic acid acyltransferase DltB (MBOAT superfamily)